MPVSFIYTGGLSLFNGHVMDCNVSSIGYPRDLRYASGSYILVAAGLKMNCHQKSPNTYY